MQFLRNLKLNFFCLAGYLYFGTILVLLALIIFAILGLLITTGKSALIKLFIQLGIPVFIFGSILLKGFFKAIFTKLPAPDGIALDKSTFAQFYTLIDNIRIHTKCPKIHHIRLSLEFNAYIAEKPLFGILGWYKRYLVIGIPLIMALNKEELSAVIAHECGHLSKAHGRTGVKVYRAQNLWEQISEEFSKNNKEKNKLITFFIYRYMPALNDALFSMKKKNEFEADKIAASVAGNQAVVSALLKSSFYGSYTDHFFWPEIRKMNDEMQYPPEDLYNRMLDFLQKPAPEEYLQSFIEGYIKLRSLPNSTHPTFIERVEALGAELPKNAINIDYDTLKDVFDALANTVLDMGNVQWHDSVMEGWKKYYDESTGMKNELNELNNLYESGQLDEDRLIKRASLIESIEGADKAAAAYTEIKEKIPESVAADYNLGRLKIHRLEEDGVRLLKEVMDKDYQSIPYCCYELVNYYLYNNDRETASEYYHIAVQVMETNNEIKEERSKIRFSDKFIPHDLGYNSIENIKSILSKCKEIKKAYVVIKHLELSGSFPEYIIGIRYKKWAFARWKKLQEELLNSGLMPWEYWIVLLNGRNRELEYQFDKVPESRIL